MIALVLRLRDITVLADDVRHPPLLDGVDLDLAPGEALAIVGANGSGKTTLARVCAGLHAPDRGSVVLERAGAAVPVGPGDVGLVAQDPGAMLVAATVAEELAFAPACAGRPRSELVETARRLAALLDLADLLDRGPDQLSGGEAQRVAIGAMLATDAPVLVLDEPTAHLDAARAGQVVDAVRALLAHGIAVAWITQQLADATWCDRTMVLERGRVMRIGPTVEVLGDEGLLARAGLDVPPAVRLAGRLRALGVDLAPDVVTLDGIVDAVAGRAVGR